MPKYNLERFTGGRRVVELADGATKGATVGVDLFYNGVVVRWEDIYNGGTSGTPTIGISDWSLLLNIPANVSALAGVSGTGIYVITGAGTSATRDIVSTDGSVAITNPAGLSGDIDLSVPVPDTAMPYFIPDGETYTIALYKQGLFTIPIDLGLGSGLLIDGILVEVD